jgi:hypothetical protein
VSRIHKPDHSYNGGESGGLYNTYAFWKEGKERYLGVVRGAAEVYVVYVVVLPADPGLGLVGGGGASVEIRHKLPLRALRKVVCPGGEMGASRVGGNLELKFQEGSAVELSATPQMFAGENDNGYDTREAVVWNLVQLQKYLYKMTLSVDGIESEVRKQAGRHYRGMDEKYDV